MQAFTLGHTAIERVPKYDSLQDFMRKWLAWNHGEQNTVAMPPAIQQTQDPYITSSPSDSSNRKSIFHD